VCTNSTENIWHNKEAENLRWSWTIFFSLSCFYRYHRTKDSTVHRQEQKKYILFWQKEKTTVKTQFIVNNHGIIIHKTNHKKGRRHEYDIYKVTHPITLKKVLNVVDIWYLGIEKDFPDQLSALSHRKKRNLLQLYQEQKEYNQGHAQKRIIIEHIMCRLKKYRILADIFRNNLRKYNKVSNIVSNIIWGLVNYRIMNHYPY